MCLHFLVCSSGVGRLVAACEAPPLVVPIVHAGMEAVMPRGCSLPVPGQQVCMLAHHNLGCCNGTNTTGCFNGTSGTFPIAALRLTLVRAQDKGAPASRDQNSRGQSILQVRMLSWGAIPREDLPRWHMRSSE